MNRRRARWALLLASVFTLLTNAYYLRFLEPAVSRKALGALIVLATMCWILAEHYGVPASRRDLLQLGRRLAPPAALTGILLLAFVLRYQGASSGLPQSYVPDEYDYVHSYLQMIKRGDLNPRWWYHPSLQPYVNVATYLVVFFLEVPEGRWSSVHQLTVEDMLFWGRFGAGVIPGTLTVLIAFFLGRRLFGTRVGLIGAFLLAVYPGAVEVSQYNKPDALLVLMGAVSVLAILAYLDRGGGRLALLSGIAIGLTVATKYNGALVLLPFLLAVVLRHGGGLLARPDLYLGAAGAILGFVGGCPYFFADLPRFLDQVADGLFSYGFTGREGAEGIDNWYTHFSYTVRYGAGWGSTLAALGGLGLALHRLDARLAVFLVFPVFYYSFYSSQRILFPGNLIPVYPFLALLAAYGLLEAAAALARRAPRFRPVEPWAIAFVLAVLAWFPLSMTLHRNELVTLPDTGTQARQWIEARFPPGTHFAVERHTPVLDPRRYTITMESRIVNRAVRDYRAEGVQYLIVSSIVFERFGPEHRLTRSYQKLFQICPLVAEFEPVEGRLMGPTIRILSVPPAEEEPVTGK